MGTRADFYVGLGAEAEWLGSIAWDGYPDGHPEPLLELHDEKGFRDKVAEILSGDEGGGTTPDQGWPWPWNDSRTTDFSYAFDDGNVWISCFGSKWVAAAVYDSEEDEDDGPKEVFPNMSDRKNVQLSGNRSGLIVVRGNR